MNKTMNKVILWTAIVNGIMWLVPMLYHLKDLGNYGFNVCINSMLINNNITFPLIALLIISIVFIIVVGVLVSKHED